MKLIEALRIDRNARLAIVGAGGKTSAMFRLGREFTASAERKPASVWLSATTHLSTDQLKYTDRHIEFTSLPDLSHFLESSSTGTVLFTGPPVENERTAGVSLPVLEALRKSADELMTPIVIEADGSRRLPIKAPAEHEPVIPDWIEQVVVVAGLSAIGQPLTHEWVHRPEIFARLSGLTLGDTVTPEALVAVLGNRFGGLKGIPEHAKRILLLNQALSAEQQAAGQWIASQLTESYQAIILAQLRPPVGEGNILAVYERVAGVVLAAGASTRLGRPKQLLKWRGHALVYHAAKVGVQAGLNPLIVVTGHAGEDVARAVEDLPVSCLKNSNWQAGQSTSVITAMQALPKDVGAVIFLLADQPLIPVDLVRELIALHAESLPPIVAPLIDGQRSNPVLFDRKLFHDFAHLTGDRGGRVLFSRYPVSWLEWHQQGIDLDIDTEQDYKRLMSLEE